jgi:hypothetical protein
MDLLFVYSVYEGFRNLIVEVFNNNLSLTESSYAVAMRV